MLPKGPLWKMPKTLWPATPSEIRHAESLHSAWLGSFTLIYTNVLSHKYPKVSAIISMICNYVSCFFKLTRTDNPELLTSVTQFCAGTWNLGSRNHNSALEPETWDPETPQTKVWVFQKIPASFKIPFFWVCQFIFFIFQLFITVCQSLGEATTVPESEFGSPVSSQDCWAEARKGKRHYLCSELIGNFLLGGGVQGGFKGGGFEHLWSIHPSIHTYIHACTIYNYI